MIAQQLSLDDAIRLRDEGIAQVIEGADAVYRVKYQEAIRLLAVRKIPFTADDARGLAGDPPASTHPNLSGALFQQASRAGLIRERVRARIAHRHRVVTAHGRQGEITRGSGRPGAQGGTTAARSLPSGPALNPTGFALSVLILSSVGVILGVGALAWIGWGAIDGLAGLFKEKDGDG